MKRLRPILPGIKGPSIESDQQSTKKVRRILVACNYCRAKRLALRESLKHHSDVVEYLQSVPESEALALIRHMRSAGDISKALSSVKGSAHTAMRVSEQRTARAILPQSTSDIEFELTTLHYSVYPALEFLDVKSIDLDSVVSSVQRTLSPVLPSKSRARAKSEATLEATSPSSESAAKATTRRFRELSPIVGPTLARGHCDARLSRVDFGFWTVIPINQEFAASAISEYLVNYHPIFGCFDADLFLADLLDQKTDHCSPFLFSAVMALACQSYCDFDVRSTAYSMAFLEEAERLWCAESSAETLLNLAAQCCLCQATTLGGPERLRGDLFRKIRHLGIKMNLFGVQATQELVSAFFELPIQESRQSAHVAWGVYAWVSETIKIPPGFPIPGDSDRGNLGDISLTWAPHILPSYMGQTHPTMSRFAIILQEVNAVNKLKDIAEDIKFAAIEASYQKLLAWADSLRPEMFRGDHSTAQVYFFHAIYHGTVLNLFRPFIDAKNGLRLRSFSSTDSTPARIFSASLTQLKRILYDSLLLTPCYSVCGWINAACLQISNAVLRDAANDPSWQFYFRLCFHYWKRTYPRYRTMLHVAQGVMSLAIDRGAIKSSEAKALIEELSLVGKHHKIVESVVLASRVDLWLAMSDPKQANMDAIAQRFEEAMMFEELISTTP
ncbi:nitrate assimilation regulatory protein nirA [Periconia macrospinosa]|uniref:Nitrate assimilation regulatory protein nirA n=1 Tax=Periconia macrospinosa TaxID=97972 RepID=A0A2V1DUN9_9PLEO|nr:nitrate assimilation regulatory protein nirA [Periconia macrospinosa]